MKYLLFWIMYVFNAIMEDVNTVWDEEGIHFSSMGYWRYKRKNYWNDKMRKDARGIIIEKI